MKLGRMRAAFVLRVSAENLTQLLEALVTEGVFTELEKRRLLEENPVTADKARCFIDTVRNKGETACSIMSRHLQAIDQFLFSDLCSSSDPSAQKGEATSL
uniref:CARD domain-containing protein n=1 Tax=Amphilophus citrinellus TaxID=61819 RepID=A0A3Q0RST7_AMPCI